MKLRLFVYGLYVSVLSFFPLLAVAVEGTPKETGVSKAIGGLVTSATTAGLTTKSLDVPVLIGKILAVVLGFTGTIFFILVIYAGLMWMTAVGNEENIKKAQSILKTAIIGLIIVLSAYAITKFIGSSLPS
jgi:phage shock protein PspC (stress-responsive transcriptional regulator)